MMLILDSLAVFTGMHTSVLNGELLVTPQSNHNHDLYGSSHKFAVIKNVQWSEWTFRWSSRHHVSLFFYFFYVRTVARNGYTKALIISPVTRCAATSNLSYPITCACLRLLKCVMRDHNSNNCTHSGNVCCCTYTVNNDYDKFRSFSRLIIYDFISASNLRIFAWKSRQIFSFSLQWPGGSTRWQ